MIQFFQIFAACQGAALLAVAIVIIIYYLRISKADSDMKVHVICITCSYCLLIGCTMFSVYFNFYSSGSPWRYMLIMAYTLGDAALYAMIIRVVKKHNTKRQNKIKDNLFTE